ncbi:hypothetical protein Tco_0876575 [Tanacetum coccineum]|uniref:Uncharacterized protein n=1 Tax=Tanacetum coccineum TaxID=301880 RepID=A0ABQ5BUE0_9ASTR
MVSRTVLMKSGLVSINTATQNISKTAVSVNTARQVNTAHSKTTVNAARPKSHFSKIAHSIVKRPIHKNTTFKNSNFNQSVNTVKDKNVNATRPKAVVIAARPKAVVNVVKGNNVNVVKASACWIQVSDGLGNMSYLIDYEEIDGGYVAFGGNPKGGKITGKVHVLIFTNLEVIDEESQDETSGILKSFITGIENLLDHKVKVIRDDEKKVDEDPRKDSESIDQEKDVNVNSTNNVNAASTNEVNAIDGKTNIKLPDDPNMPNLEDISIFDLSRDNEDVGAEADMNN